VTECLLDIGFNIIERASV